jgi:transposase
MGQRTLVPDAGEVQLDCAKADGGRFVLVLRSTEERSCCPRCHRSSDRVHSHYQRVLADLPWEGVPVRIQLHVRRFFCSASACQQQIFTERLPHTVRCYGRRTCRLGETIQQIALALGGQGGSRLARQLGILASGSTFLRELRRRAMATPKQGPRVLGIDDWAWRKGHRYGTILCDLEQGKVIDLLPERSEESTEEWMRHHPGTEIVSRDRASLYAEAATKAAPQAIQVADRWHLLHNLTETLVDALAPHHRLLTEVAKATSDKPKASEPSPAQLADPAPPRSRRQRQRQKANRERRLACYEAVMAELRQGLTQAEIARRNGLGIRTVRRWIRAQGFPERKVSPRSTRVDPQAEYIRQRWQQGCHNASRLWRELRERGFKGQAASVRNWIRKHYGPRRCRAKRRPPQSPSPATRASPRHVAWLLLKEPQDARNFIDELYRRSPQIDQCARLAREFCRMIRERDVAAWPRWREQATTTVFANFAKRLGQDEAALLSALKQPWSNGPVEGQIHRLKLIKRSMYGRAKFDLLRLRVVLAA